MLVKLKDVVFLEIEMKEGRREIKKEGKEARKDFKITR